MAETSLRYFKQVLSVVTEFNISEAECLSAAGLTELPGSDRVSADYLAQMLRFAEKSLNDPLIGVKCALKYPILQYTRPAEFLRLCTNLEHAAEVYHRYSPLFHSVGTPSGIISEDGIDRMIWVPGIATDQTEDYRLFIELIMTNLVTSINWLAWKTPNAVRRLNIGHEATLPPSDYAELFDCEVKFGQSEYSLILKEGVKAAPFAMSDQAELTKVRMRFDMALNELLEDKSLVDRIELQIRRTIEHGNLNKASVAKTLGIAERTMARSLKTKGTCFKDIKNSVLKDMASTKIHQGVPLVEIAHALGYNDQPAFTRAFKKWFGCTPGKHNTSRR